MPGPTFNPIPSSIQISRMLRRPPPVRSVFTPMIKNPAPMRLRRAFGGEVDPPDDPMRPVAGGIYTSDPGRGDQKPVHVRGGAYVISADVVGALGQGNSLNGLKLLEHTFTPQHNQIAMMSQRAPYGATGGPYGTALPHLRGGPGVGIPRPPPISGQPSFNVSMSPLGQQSPVFSQTAHGGVVPGEPGGAFLDRMGMPQKPGTPINISGGEFVIRPEAVKRIGRGDINWGHEILDRWVQQLRQDHINTLKKLPGPAK